MTRNFKRRCFSGGDLLVPALLIVAGISQASCRVPLSSIQVVLERHRKAVEKLPAEQRERLMPYGAAVATEHAEELLPTGLLGLDTAREISIRANPDIHAAQARLENATWRIAEARARYFPTVVFTHNSSRTFHTPASRNRINTLLQPGTLPPSDIDTGNIAITTLLNALRLPLFDAEDLKGSSTPFSEHSTSLTASWTIFDGFAREAQLLSVKYLHGASMSALVDVERLIIHSVESAYYRVQLAEEQLRIALADESFSQEQFDETEKLRGAGRATKADVDNFRVRVLAARADVTAARGAREIGRVILAELMGITSGTLPAELELAPLADEKEEELAAPRPEEWIRRAIENRPDLRQLKQILRSDDENLRATRGLFLPSVVASGSWGFDRSSNVNYDREDQSSAAAVEFRWELFSGGSRTARVRQAESIRAESEATLNRLRLSVQSMVRQAGIDVVDAQGQIVLRREALETARENRRIVQAGYVAGKETLTRLNQAQRDYIAADADLALARIRLRQAWSDLNSAAATYRKTTPPSATE